MTAKHTTPEQMRAALASVNEKYNSNVEFERLLTINENAVIVTRGGPGAVVSIKGGNWQDSNIGSQMQPMMFSEACECH